MRPEDITDRRALVDLPLTRKSDLIEMQRRDPPFGGLAAVPVSAVARIFASPGPIYEPEARRPDFFRMARALYAAGIRPSDLVHNSFSYHLTPAGAMVESAALALGCPVIPAGTGQTEQQLRTIADLRPSAYVGTPSFLKILLDRAAEQGVDIASHQKRAGRRRGVSGGAASRVQRARHRRAAMLRHRRSRPDRLREPRAGRRGVRGHAARRGHHRRDRPSRHRRADAPEEVGEVVVTTLTPEYPLIRFATGDLSAYLPGASPCGRTNHRIRGWLGRADQSVKVRGLFVHPVQIAEIVRRHKSIIRARLVVERVQSADDMTLLVEIGEPEESERRSPRPCRLLQSCAARSGGCPKEACRMTAR